MILFPAPTLIKMDSYISTFQDVISAITTTSVQLHPCRGVGVYRAAHRGGGGGGATGAFCPGPQPERGPMNTC